MKHCSADWNQL